MKTRLIQGDCIVEMQKLIDEGVKVDMVLTDPPYIFDNHGGGKAELASTRTLIKDKHIDFISKGFDTISAFELFKCLSKTPNYLIFCSNKQVSSIMSYFERLKLSTTLLVWHKTNPSPLCNGKHISDVEFVVYVRGKGATFNNDTPFAYKRKVYTSGVVSNKDRLHPTQKSVEQIEQYLLLHTKEGDTVLDPFMGSGSTGVACKNLNRNFIGIELDEKYFEIAKDRIANHTMTASLFE